MKELTKIVLRVISIFLGVRTIPIIFMFISVYFVNEDTTSMGSGIFSYGFILLCIIALWFFADKIADLILDRKDETIELKEIQIDVYGILNVAIFVIGIFFIADALPKLINVTVNVIVLGVEHMGYFTEGIKLNLIPQLVENLVEVIIGIVFVLSRRKIMVLFDSGTNEKHNDIQ